MQNMTVQKRPIAAILVRVTMAVPIGVSPPARSRGAMLRGTTRRLADVGMLIKAIVYGHRTTGAWDLVVFKHVVRLGWL